MESSTSSLTFKGSISEAIVEAQKQRKLFLVYISGGDDDSILLEQSTWTHANVAEAISKHCVFVHLVQGSVDVFNFSACYPQNSVPSISIIGFNGILLWQHEGYVNSEKLIADIQKAWLSLHLQETAATVLTAALVSNKPENSSSSDPNAAVHGQINSSGSDFPPSSTGEVLERSEAKQLLTQEPTTENKSEKAKEFTVNCSEKSNSISTSEKAKELHTLETVDVNSSEVESRSFDVGDGSLTVEESTINDHQATKAPDSTRKDYPDSGSVFSQESSQMAVEGLEVNKSVRDNKSNVSFDSTPIKKPSEVHLNIRLPDGTSLQAKFHITDALGLVKRYIDENQINEIGSYSLAVPFPRKVFGEEDMSKALSELGLINREALIVVPHHPSAGSYTEQSSSRSSIGNNSGSLSNDSGGRFGYLGKMFSYMNPFSYFSGSSSSSNSESASSDRLWQYRPNPTLKNSLSAANASHHAYAPNSDGLEASGRVGNNRKASTARFGSNIHTLKHDEDDSFSNRNAFWNGNSTQFGGDDPK